MSATPTPPPSASSHAFAVTIEPRAASVHGVALAGASLLLTGAAAPWLMPWPWYAQAVASSAWLALELPLLVAGWHRACRVAAIRIDGPDVRVRLIDGAVRAVSLAAACRAGERLAWLSLRRDGRATTAFLLSRAELGDASWRRLRVVLDFGRAAG